MLLFFFCFAVYMCRNKQCCVVWKFSILGRVCKRVLCLCYKVVKLVNWHLAKHWSMLVWLSLSFLSKFLFDFFFCVHFSVYLLGSAMGCWLTKHCQQQYTKQKKKNTVKEHCIGNLYSPKGILYSYTIPRQV